METVAGKSCYLHLLYVALFGSARFMCVNCVSVLTTIVSYTIHTVETVQRDKLRI